MMAEMEGDTMLDLQYLDVAVDHKTDEVWGWPETQAFLRRLGVDVNLNTKRLVIAIDFPKRSVQVKQCHYVVMEDDDAQT